jgi:hypothetical protein
VEIRLWNCPESATGLSGVISRDAHPTWTVPDGIFGSDWARNRGGQQSRVKRHVGIKKRVRLTASSTNSASGI